MADFAASISADILQLEPGDETGPRFEAGALLSRIACAAAASTLQAATASERWVKGWKVWTGAPGKGPDIVKKYDGKNNLAVSIFFPSTYDQTSPQVLPTLFTIHGGGFTLGGPADDDLWNRTFSDTHNALVIALNYAKAPWSPFPGPVHDVASLYLSSVSDPSLPVDPARVAVAGFSAGGNLALSLCQLPTVRQHAAAPRAVVPIYPCVDMSRTTASKAARRHYKTGSGLAGLGGQDRDWVLPLAPVFDWAHIPPGTSLRHPLLSPFYAKRADLPPRVFVIGAELDFLVDEAHQFALRLAGREAESVYDDIPGRVEASGVEGKLELEDARFAWEEEESGVRWLLVPDVVHAFDYHSGVGFLGDEGAVRDANMKTEAYIRVLGEWLLAKAWA